MFCFERMKMLLSEIAEESEDEFSERSDDDEKKAPLIPDEGNYTHFSTFLLSGTDGAVRWRHLPGDFEARQITVSVLVKKCFKT